MENVTEHVDQRAHALQDWTVDWLRRERPDLSPTGALSTVSGDASFRRYFRLPIARRPSVEGVLLGGSLVGRALSKGSIHSLIAVDAPPDKENSRPFVAIARALRTHGVHVPEVIAADFERGFMLLEDFGDTLLRSCLTPATAQGLYHRALQTLQHLLSCTDVPDYRLLPYDRQRLRDEMNLLRDWFVERYLGLTLDAGQQAVLADACNQIADAVLVQPQVFVHRDYHSRNLMLLADGEIGVIDFQDAVTGAITYDLVSLLRDAYVVWPPAQVTSWVREFAAMLRQEQRLTGVDDATFLRWFDWMGAQRHLKVVGIFARLSLRDGKHGYLDDIPCVFNYLLAELQPYHELRALFDLLRGVVLPTYLARCSAATVTLGHWGA
jgi:aminoglycoside/choline kinase family phosphotransferase